MHFDCCPKLIIFILSQVQHFYLVQKLSLCFITSPTPPFISLSTAQDSTNRPINPMHWPIVRYNILLYVYTKIIWRCPPRVSSSFSHGSRAVTYSFINSFPCIAFYKIMQNMHPNCPFELVQFFTSHSTSVKSIFVVYNDLHPCLFLEIFWGIRVQHAQPRNHFVPKTTTDYVNLKKCSGDVFDFTFAFAYLSNPLMYLEHFEFEHHHTQKVQKICPSSYVS